MKKVLFISHYNYHKEIINTLKELGYDVTFYNDKPNDSFLYKFAGRYKINFFNSFFANYYDKIIEKTKNVKFDYVFLINAEYIPLHSLNNLRERNKESVFILYMWDSISNKGATKEKLKFFDYCYSFDTYDVNHTEELTLMPLFYIKNFHPIVKNKYDYDIAFVGTAHDDRPKIINQVKEQCEKAGRKIYCFLYSPHVLVYMYTKLTNKNYKGIHAREMSFEKIPYAVTAEIYQNSKCVIDIENSGQSGLTIRTIEILGLKKKLITTNKEIIKYDFYNSNNIMVVDRENFIIDFEFVDKPFVDLPNNIYESYSLRSRLKEIFEKSI